MIHLNCINGSEQHTAKNTPENALIQFYHAFNNQNLELMKQNWLHTEDTSMSNPLGGIKRGWSEIKQVYERIFNGPAEVFVEFYNFSIHKTDTMFFAVGQERGHLKLNEKEIKLAIRTTRIYKKENNQWKHIHHHGSIDQAALLSNYQSTVLNQS